MEADEVNRQTPLNQGNGKEESEEGFAIKSQKVLELDEENQEAYDDLIVSIEAKEGALNLLIAVCDDADFRDRIITQYETELQPHFRPYRVTLALVLASFRTEKTLVGRGTSSCCHEFK